MARHLRTSIQSLALIRRRAGEAVPVRELFQVTQYLRVCAILLLLVCAGVAPQALAPGLREALIATAGYAGVAIVAQALSRRLRVAVVVWFSVMLMIDGLWLAWTSSFTGSLSSPIRYLVLVHLGAVALLASYRTAVKLAIWHSLLLVAMYIGQGAGGWFTSSQPVDVGNLGGTVAQRLVVFVVVLWLVTVSTSALSAVNERELRRRQGELEALTDLAEALERTVDSKSVASTLLGCVIDGFGFPRGVVAASPEGTLQLLASVGIDPAVERRPGRPSGSAVVTEAHATHATSLVSSLDPAADPWLSRLLPGARNLIVVPLHAEGRPLGALVLEQSSGERDHVSRRVVSGLERSAAYAALALRNAWLLETVQRLAATDELTKIANRRTFETSLEKEMGRAARSSEPLSLVIIDIDHFKRLNDEHGHQAGDEVLRNVAAALTMACRDFDTAARYGGEEFAVILPGCGPQEALEIAERLRSAVAAAPAVVPITASAGVATYPDHATDPDTLVRAADDALYASKREGRNRTSGSAGVPPEAQVDAMLRRAINQRLGRSRSVPDGTSLAAQVAFVPTSPAPAPRTGEH